MPPPARRPLVGRSGELHRLQAALERAVDHRPGGMLMGGEAGIGKTRLLDELADLARARGALVLAGQCVDLEAAAIPLLPITDALAPLADEAGEDLWAAARGAPMGAQRVLAAHAELLQQRSAHTPVLLVVDDLQWADRSTLALLTFVLRRVRDERLLVAASYRSEELDRRDELRAFLADVARAGVVERLELGPLSDAEAMAQLADILGAPPEPGRAAAILSRAEGSPLFVEELAGVPADEAAKALPMTLRDMLLTRLRRLSRDAQLAVRVAAAAGRRMHHDLLSEVAGLTGAALSAALREAVRDHILVTRDAGYAFRHPLLQEAAYAELLPGERVALHRRLAEVLDARPELAGGNAATVAAEIAHHINNTGDIPRTLSAEVRAGIEAEHVSAPAEASDHFRRALVLWDRVDGARQRAGMERAALFARAAQAVASAGRYGEATELVDSAIALVDEAADPVRAGTLHERRGWYSWYDGRGQEAISAYERAVALIPAEPASAERAGAVARLGLLLLLTGDPAAARPRCEEAIACARAAGARVEEAEAIVALGITHSATGDWDAAMACLRPARDIGREAGAPLLEARAAINLAHVLRRLGRPDEALDVGLDGAQRSRAAGLDFAEGGLCLANAAEAAFELGRWDLVDELTQRLLERAATGMTRVWALNNRAMLLIARGDFDAAEAVAAERRALEPQVQPESAAAIAMQDIEIALWRKRPDDALRRAEEAAGAVRASDEFVHAEVVALGVRAAADAAALARDRHDDAAADSALQRAELLRGAANGHDRRPAPAASATIDAELARAAGGSEPTLWDAAARAWDARGARHPAAYARWRQAEALLANGAARTVAGNVLRAAEATAQDLGARPLAAEIAALARRARIELAADSPAVTRAGAAGEPADAFGLTPREREVLEHLALGQTNRQIAQELFISIKTVGAHVAHIFEKLGASTRGEAAAIAHRQQLL
jgi:DNA-binding CsgD family transcriptional regulator/tetratricopeptide (TPR) repeat protein